MPGRRRTPTEKFVMISVVAERFGIHPQTLRLYEREVRRLPQTVVATSA